MEREWKWDLDNSGWWYFQTVKASDAGLVWSACYPHEKDDSPRVRESAQTLEQFLQQGPPIPMVIPEAMLLELVTHLGAQEAPWWRSHSAQGEQMLALASQKNEDGVKALISSGVSVNYRDLKGRDALYFALQKGAPALALWLLAQGARVDLRYPRPGTQDAQPIEEGRDMALHFAIRGRHLEVAKRLIELGADVNAIGEGFQRSALHDMYFFDTPSTEVLRSALSAGLDVSDSRGSSFVKDALKARNREAAELLFSHGVDGTKGSILHHASAYPDLVRRLLVSGAEVNGLDERKRTPLICAVLDKAPLETMRLLLAARADVKATDANGDSALSFAASIGAPKEVLSLLVGAEAELDVQNKRGMTPLLDALVMSKWEAALFLLEAGADTTIAADKVTVRYLLSKERPKEVSVELWERLLSLGLK